MPAYTFIVEGRHDFYKWYKFFKKYRLHFCRAVLRAWQNWEEGAEVLHVPPGSTHAWTPPLSTSATQGVQLLQPVSLRWHIITSSPQFTLGSFLMLYIPGVLTNVCHDSTFVVSHRAPALSWKSFVLHLLNNVKSAVSAQRRSHVVFGDFMFAGMLVTLFI